jgi:hypothetical protein
MIASKAPTNLNECSGMADSVETTQIEMKMYSKECNYAHMLK